MASTDLEEFIQECLRNYDPNVDLTTGSAAQQAVVRPLLRRLGADPFTMSLEKFIGTRLAQEFPDLNITDGDALMDMLVKPARVLLEPLVQEIKRVRDNLSVADADIMTLAEADALGANLYAERTKGDFARVTARLYYTAPQNSVVTPSNYVYTGGSLRYYPVMIQSISTNQMMFNKEGGYYYFDVAVVAEKPGDVYSIAAQQLVGVYGMPAVIKVTNKLAASAATDEETAAEYMDRLGEDLTERSLVTLPGILAVRRKYFPTIRRVAVVGMGDPEMQRDVLQGAGIGAIVAYGKEGALTDSGAGTYCILCVQDAVDFTQLIGPVGCDSSLFTLTVHGGSLPAGEIRDFAVRRVVSSTALELTASGLATWHPLLGMTAWALRKNALMLSGVPGGTAVEGANGPIVSEGDKVHIGGMVDILVTATSTDQGTLTLSAVTDESPELSGVSALPHIVAQVCLGFALKDLTLGANYKTTDEVYRTLDTAKDQGLVLQVLNGDAGSYRILGVVQEAGKAPIVYTDPAPTGYPTDQRWRILGKVDINLLNPKDVRVSGSDLFTVQGNALAQAQGIADFSEYSVVKGDTLEILTGKDAGTYTLTEDGTNTNQLVVDRPFSYSTAGVSYRVYRKLASAGVSLPLVRVSSINLLDSSGQSLGIPVPYAAPVGLQAFDFTTPTNALHVDISDALIGCVSQVFTPSSVNGRTLYMFCSLWGGTGIQSVIFSGVSTVSDVVAQINNSLGVPLAHVVDGNRVGISPYKGQYSVCAQKRGAVGTDAFEVMFDTVGGAVMLVATNMIRSATISQLSTGWRSFTFDTEFDAVQVVSAADVQFTSKPVPTQAGKVLMVQKNMHPAVGGLVRIGPRAVGRVRCFFLDPTTFEVASGTYENPTRFVATLEDGTELGFVPDPTMDTLRYPPPPSTTRALDGIVTLGSDGGALSSASVDFSKKQILPGDELVLDYVPIIADRACTTNIAGLALGTLVMRINGVERTMVFSGDVAGTPSAVSLDGVVSQLNRVLGAGVARFNGSNFLELEPSYDLALIGGTALGAFWLTFSTTYPQGVSNQSVNYQGGKRYTIWNVTPTAVYVLEALVPCTRQQFKIYRPGAQRVGTTQMALNKTYAGLYYADIQVVSEGSGHLYNVAAGTSFSVTGYKSLGYTLSAEVKHLTYSTAEKPWLHITPTLMGVGSSDDPEMAVQVAGQNLQVAYDWSSDAAAFQNFVGTAQRVLTANILVRHLFPHYVRFDVAYRGGASDSVVKQTLQAYILGLQPEDVCEAVQIQDVILSLGASTVATPIHLTAVVHREDRSLVLEQSMESIAYNRLAGFFAEQITVTKTG